jgi:hypothetical protein
MLPPNGRAHLDWHTISTSFFLVCIVESAATSGVMIGALQTVITAGVSTLQQ